MTEAAKVKAGIKPAQTRSKKITKDAKIRELEARIAELEYPEDPHPSKDPLVSSLFPSGYFTQVHSGHPSLSATKVHVVVSLRWKLTKTAVMTTPVSLVTIVSV